MKNIYLILLSIFMISLSCEAPDNSPQVIGFTTTEDGGKSDVVAGPDNINAVWESYIDAHVGFNGETYGDLYFTRTLNDWSKFNLNNRTKHDASISSGLAIMACNKNKYAPVAKRTFQPVNLGIRRYNNDGVTSKII